MSDFNDRHGIAIIWGRLCRFLVDKMLHTTMERSCCINEDNLNSDERKKIKKPERKTLF